MNRLPKYVLTHRPLNGAWSHSSAVGLGDIPALKRAAEEPIAVFADPTAIGAILRARMLDQIRLLRQPVILGQELPLFTSNAAPIPLDLVRADTLATGAILEIYRPPESANRGDGS